MSQVGAAFVVVKPLVADFRSETAAAVSRSLGTATIPLPVSPAIPRGSSVTWEKLATGASVPKVVPLPVQPTISPAAKAQFAGEAKGIRGALLGAGQFGASRALGISGLAAGLFAFAIAGTKAVAVAADLEQSLNVFEQVSGATADQMARVREEARRLGADISLPAVSAGDAAATMTELAKAGLSVDEVLKGTRGTLQLAAAAQLDFAQAAQLSAGALNEFELPGSQAVKIADLLAGAANAAQGDIGDFGLALSQAGAVAHQAGLSVQDTVTFLTELAKAGIQGSDAGTSLRVALLRLIAPTKEARDIFKELGIQITDEAGNVRVDVFEQLRQSMLRLDPATRNAALAVIFGTDAIRSAAIFTREGAKGFDALQGQVSRQGQAAETAEARTKGLSGSLKGLSSNLETLGSDLGKIALPGLTLFSDTMSHIVKTTDEAVISIETFVSSTGDRLGDLASKIEHSRLGRFFGKIGADALDAANKARRAEDRLLGLRGQHVPTGIPAIVSFEGAGDRSSPQFDRAAEQAAARAKDAGKKVGAAFVHAAGTEITRQEQSVINAAKRTVSDAQAALRDVVAEGARAVEESAVSAKANLAAIGQGLATQVTDILQSGPLAQRINALTASLKASQDALQRQNLTRSLRDAKEDLAKAEAQLAGGAPKTPAQIAGEREFLRPFQEKVKDAQSALGEFNTQGTIDTLTAKLQAQTAKVGRQINDVVARFNAGLISAGQANARVVAILQKNVGPMNTAGAAQGFAFRQGFHAQLVALQAQIAAIVGGPQTKKTGAEPTLVKPADAVATAAKNTAAAQRSVRDAVASLHETERKAVAEQSTTNAVLRDIRRELRGRVAKPSGDVKTPPKPRVKAGGPR